MQSVMLVAGMCTTLSYDAKYDYIGIDHGAIVCMDNHIPLVAAIGDFDSTSQVELTRLQAYTTIHQLPAHKNETDSEEAIIYALKQGYKELVLYGGLGGRIDHEIANLHLLFYRDYPITLMDAYNSIKVITEGTYKINKEHKYLSFLALENSCISETGVVYPLDEQILTPSDIYAISNEIEKKEAEVIVHYGKLLLIQSDDKKRYGKEKK